MDFEELLEQHESDTKSFKSTSLRSSVPFTFYSTELSLLAFAERVHFLPWFSLGYIDSFNAFQKRHTIQIRPSYLSPIQLRLITTDQVMELQQSSAGNHLPSLLLPPAV